MAILTRLSFTVSRIYATPQGQGTNGITLCQGMDHLGQIYSSTPSQLYPGGMDGARLPVGATRQGQGTHKFSVLGGLH